MVTTDEPNTDAKIIMANELARALGAGWTLEPALDSMWHSRRLKHADGYSLFLNWSRKPGRLVIDGEWPRDRALQIYAPGKDWSVTPPREIRAEITCAVDRTPTSIAQAIKTRLLPDYLKHWHAMNERAKESDQLVDLTNASVETLVKAFPEVRRPERSHASDRAIEQTLYPSFDGVYKLQVYGDKVSLELRRVPLAAGLSILGIVREHERKAV